MRLWLFVLMILIAQVLAGPLLWIGVAIWGVVAIYSLIRKATKRYKI